MDSDLPFIIVQALVMTNIYDISHHLSLHQVIAWSLHVKKISHTNLSEHNLMYYHLHGHHINNLHNNVMIYDGYSLTNYYKLQC